MTKTMMGSMWVGVAAMGLTSVAAMAAPVKYTNVAVVDVMCSKNTSTTAAADKHTVSCALDCADGGFAVITADDKVLKLDKAGNEKMLAALKATKVVDHVRVNVSGDLDGDVLKVTEMKLQ
jgi:hypothetical protein